MVTITHPWMTITHEWPVTISLLPRPGCDRCLVTVIRSAQMSALPRVRLMTPWWRGRLSQARCPVKPNNFMVHNYQSSIASPSLQSQLLLHLMGMVITLSSHCITHTNGLEFCPIINLICQMIVKTRITQAWLALMSSSDDCLQSFSFDKKVKSLTIYYTLLW